MATITVDKLSEFLLDKGAGSKYAQVIGAVAQGGKVVVKIGANPPQVVSVSGPTAAFRVAQDVAANLYKGLGPVVVTFDSKGIIDPWYKPQDNGASSIVDPLYKVGASSIVDPLYSRGIVDPLYKPQGGLSGYLSVPSPWTLGTIVVAGTLGYLAFKALKGR